MHLGEILNELEGPDSHLTVVHKYRKLVFSCGGKKVGEYGMFWELARACKHREDVVPRKGSKLSRTLEEKTQTQSKKRVDVDGGHYA